MNFDTIIIGGGPGGYELAATLARRGESVAVIERDALGGTCLNRGCIPTKALGASARAVLEAAAAPSLGVDTGDIRVDFDRVRARAAEVVDGLRQGVTALLGACAVVRGEASFEGPRTVRVADDILTAPRIVIATGSHPASLAVPGAELAITSDEALWLPALPESMVIIGGGVIGMEFASIFSALGSKVTVVEYCREIIPTIDPEIAKRLRTALGRRGIDIVTSAAVERIDKTADRTLRVTWQGKKGQASADADTVVMAVGRRPVVPPGFSGRLTDRGFIEVDPMMRTSVDGVYAVGDVNGLLMLAHTAYAQGRVVADANPALFAPELVPAVVFTTPEVASIGPDAAALALRGESVHTVKHMYASNGKACADGHPDGLVKLLVRDADNTIAAATIIGHHAADLIAEATMLVTDRVPIDQVASRYIHAHPTLSELFV